MNHRPGPWYAEFDRYGGYDCMTAAWSVKSAADWPICYVDCAKDNQENDPQAEADAYMLAAAPELYASLDDLVANARLLKQCPEPDLCDICKAEAVLKKAKGETSCQ